MRTFIRLPLLRLLPLLPLTSCSTDPSGTAVAFPLTSWVLIQDFGVWNPNFGGHHLAEDIDVPPGTEVRAIADGTVRAVFVNDQARGYGALVLVEHEIAGRAVTSLYGHLSSGQPPTVSVGFVVRTGDLLGFIAEDDEDGGPWGPHLHFGIRTGATVLETDRCGVWRFVGYTRECSGTTHADFQAAWHDPTDWLVEHGGEMPPGDASRFPME